ncbi:MAG: hypothetical protein AAF502_13930 [Bacteroidota bacterium]
MFPIKNLAVLVFFVFSYQVLFAQGVDKSGNEVNIMPSQSGNLEMLNENKQAIQKAISQFLTAKDAHVNLRSEVYTFPTGETGFTCRLKNLPYFCWCELTMTDGGIIIILGGNESIEEAYFEMYQLANPLLKEHGYVLNEETRNFTKTVDGKTRKIILATKRHIDNNVWIFFASQHVGVTAPSADIYYGPDPDQCTETSLPKGLKLDSYVESIQTILKSEADMVSLKGSKVKKTILWHEDFFESDIYEVNNTDFPNCSRARLVPNQRTDGKEKYWVRIIYDFDTEEAARKAQDILLETAYENLKPLGFTKTDGSFKYEEDYTIVKYMNVREEQEVVNMMGVEMKTDRTLFKYLKDEVIVKTSIYQGKNRVYITIYREKPGSSSWDPRQKFND